MLWITTYLGELRRCYRFAALAVLAAAVLIMEEVNSLLLTLESAGQQRYGMSALYGVRFESGTTTAAVQHWASAFGSQPFAWVFVHTGCDVVFVAGYGWLLRGVLRRLYPGRQWLWLALPVVVADLAENVGTAVLAVQARAAWGPGGTAEVPAIAGWLHVLSDLKWVCAALAAGAVAFGLVRRWMAPDTPPMSRWFGVLWRMRVQVTVVGVLGFAVVVPNGDRLGALEQLPDVLRSYFDLDHASVARLAVSALALVGLCGAIWVSAHWQRYAGSGAGPDLDRSSWSRRWPYGALLGLAVGWTLLAIVAAVRPSALGGIGVTLPPWANSWQLALPLLTGAAILFVALFCYARWGFGRAPVTPPQWQVQHARAIQLLTVLPLAIAGLGLVRAAAALALLPHNRTLGAWWVAAGVVVAGVVSAVVLALLATATGREVAADNPEPIRISRPVTAVVLLAAGAVCLALALWPVEVGPVFGAHGVLATALAVAALLFGGGVAVSQRSEPFAVDLLRAGRARTIALPGVSLLILVLVAVDLVDSVGTYHDLRYVAAAPPTARSLAGHFDAWRSAMQSCGSTETGSGPRVQPLVIVAAAGGGIRASYWTERALLELTGAEPGAADDPRAAQCRRDAIFMVSGASGGSIGSMLWSLRDPAAPRGVAPYTRAIANGDALASVSAGLLFRDVARASTGLNPDWPDRAAVMQESWTRSLAAEGVDVSRPLWEGGSGRQSLLLLNGTDLQTGCGVVIAPIASANPVAAGELPRHCAESGSAGAELPTAYFMPDFLDTAQCSSGERSLSGATAALLSARFPYITPTGLLYACSADGRRAARIQVGDGGYLDRSGMQSALQAWRAIEPLVAEHNRSVLDPDSHPSVLGDAVIVPVFVDIENSYRSVASGPMPDRQHELLAPLATVQLAPGLAGARLEAEARAAYARQIPGTTRVLPGMAVRVVTIAPVSRPEVSAPLGWALSPYAMSSLDGQLTTAMAAPDLGQLRALLGGRTPASTLGAG